ncbi:hypothetical protein MRB53_016406 [Persea americana]|uniref:Uncharacterized protein n=1 Tax=Persea americana TaxID=3435 RepID=A0ACC2M206_PERAE|nr:hypothetical protein MRB53_016406 [Persea americana]
MNSGTGAEIWMPSRWSSLSPVRFPIKYPKSGLGSARLNKKERSSDTRLFMRDTSMGTRPVKPEKERLRWVRLERLSRPLGMEQLK